jgi:NAD(P)-dependent dehydrogenase (short-subunit alcohol dehydrogenase family)
MVATDLAEFGIRVNCIAPGHIPTGITTYDLGPTIEADQPLRRQGSPNDVAEAVLFLAGDRSAQITGIVVPVDGGTVAGRPVRHATAAPVAAQGGPGPAGTGDGATG